MKNTKELILTTLFYGGIWGILEATLGFVLHLTLPLGVGTGAIMFGFAAIIMKKVSEYPNKVSLFVPLLAASIKLTNLLFVLSLPSYTTIMILKVVNPAIAIVLEGLALVVLFKLINKSSLMNQMVSVVGASFAWHVVYMIYYFGLFNIGIITPYFKNGFDVMSSLVGPGLMGGLISFAIFYSIKIAKLEKIKIELKPAYSYVAFALAMILTVIL